jgi:hypothetical protein
MSPQKRRPQARKGRTAAAAKAGGRRSDRSLAIVAVLVLALGVGLVFALKPSNSTGGGVKLGDHWHAALGVYACDHWDGAGAWATPVDPQSGEPVRVGTRIYAGLHSHHDGLIHMEPTTSDEIGKNATLGTYFKFNGFELNSTHVKFVSADLKNGDKCGSKAGTLQWSVNGHKKTGDPQKYILHEADWVIVAFLPEGKSISSVGKPPSYKTLVKTVGRANT